MLTRGRSIPQRKGIAPIPVLLGRKLTGKTNLRTDAYGGTAEKRAKFILDIIAETRKVVPSTFCVGIKLNSADHTSSTFEDTMTQIGLLVEAGIDFLEISGGSYEDPKVKTLTYYELYLAWN